MRDLSIAEFLDFLEFCQTSPASENWIPSTEEEIQVAVQEHPYYIGEIEMFQEYAGTYGLEPTIIALWFTAFQFGREFESRHLEAKALDGMVAG